MTTVAPGPVKPWIGSHTHWLGYDITSSSGFGKRLLPLAVQPRRIIFHESSIPSGLLVSRQHICLHEPHQPKPLSDLAQTRPRGTAIPKRCSIR